MTLSNDELKHAITQAYARVRDEKDLELKKVMLIRLDQLLCMQVERSKPTSNTSGDVEK